MNNGIGFIGAGNMGGALFRGIAQGFPDRPMSVFDLDREKSAELVKSVHHGRRKTAERLAAATLDEAVSGTGIVFLAVKPQVYEAALKALAAMYPTGATLVCMAPGWPIARIAQFAPRGTHIIRIMPNIQAEVGESMIAVCPAPDVPMGVSEGILELLGTVGRAELIEERLFNAVTGLSGSGGAYAFMFIEAMADGAVLKGMPREKAYLFAAQTVLGAAKMVLESGEHPGVLKDRVCSPGGTTIEAVRTLEAKGLRSAVMEAVIASTEKAQAMEKAAAVIPPRS